MPGAVLPDYTVGAALNAVRILRYLAAAGTPIRLTRIARDLELHASNCLNLLRTLTDAGMVEHDRAAKSYALGMGIMEIAHSLMTRLESPQTVQPLLDAFSQRHGVSVMLWRRASDADLVLVARSTRGMAVHIGAEVGARLPLLTGSMGYVIAGSGIVDEAALRAHFSAVAWGRTDDFESFMAKARTAHEQGWSYGSGDGRQGLSALVKGPPGASLRIVNAAMFSADHPRAQLDLMARDLISLAEALGGGPASRAVTASAGGNDSAIGFPAGL